MKSIFCRDVLYITMFVYAVMQIGAAIPIKFGVLNQFKAGVKNHDVTDIVFSKFKDKESFFDDRISMVNIGRPDRKEIIQIVEKVESYHPKAVGVDVHFSDFNHTATDTLLRNTLRKFENIYVIKRLGEYDEKSAEYDQLIECHDFFCDSLNIGYSNFLAMPGDIVREFSPTEIANGNVVLSLGVALVSHNNPEVLTSLLERNNESEIINYTQGEEGFIYIDKAEILNQSKDLTETFKNKIVLVGYLGTDDWTESVKDKFYTPLNEKITVRTVPDMYGMTIHANIVRMLLDRDYVNRTTGWTKAVLDFLLIFFAINLFRQIYLNINPGYWKIVRVVQLALFATLFLVVSGVLYYSNYKLELGTGIVGAVLSWDVVKFYENVIVRKQKFFKPK